MQHIVDWRVDEQHTQIALLNSNCYNGFANGPQCYVIRTLSILQYQVFTVISVIVVLFLITYVAEKLYCKQIFILSCYNIMVVCAK